MDIVGGQTLHLISVGLNALDILGVHPILIHSPHSLL